MRMPHESPSTLQKLAPALRSAVEGNVLTDELSLGIYATDASIYEIAPALVVVPKTRADVVHAVALAAEHGVPVLPRGGGTSLAGQTVGAALVIDFSKHLNKILEVDPEARWARVEPGLVRDELNAALAEHRLHFAPDPATSSRANVGGMIGNNSSGVRSIRYGKTVDHVLELTVLLADGSIVELGEMDVRSLPADLQDRHGEIVTGLRDLVEENRQEIAAAFPKTMRRVGGYPLDELLNEDAWNPAKVLVGSEGTLGLVLEAKIRLEPLPESTAVCVAHYREVREAVAAVEKILEADPSAVEILDRTVLTLARENLSTGRLSDFFEGEPDAVLVIEIDGLSEDDLVERRRRLERLGTEGHLGYAWPILTEPEIQRRIWQVRKASLGLMLGLQGDRKPLAFIEDAAVPVEDLSEYVSKVLDFCQERGVEVALYAHASVGVIHLRPILDLRRAEDIEHLREISEFTFERVLEYGGAWSAEHGDGLVRSVYNERFFGPHVYNVLRRVKTLFDPTSLMNPGKIVEAPPIDESLRYGTDYQASPPPTHFQYRHEGSLTAAVEMCSGVGACRQTLGGTMCPSYIATRDEEHSTRGRANALRLAMSGRLGPDALTSRRLYETFELCLSCKGCKAECPSNVDVARMKSDFLQQYYDKNGTSRRDRLIAGSADLARRWVGPVGSFLSGFANLGPIRSLNEKLLGFSRHRTLPTLASQSFYRSTQRLAKNATGGRRVALFVDTYLECHEPEIGRAAFDLLQGLGYDVELARPGCCQRPRISQGFLREAKQHGTALLQDLDRYFQDDVPVLVCEPSCASSLTDDLPDLIADQELGQRAAAGVLMIDVFLDREVAAGRCEARWTSPYQEILIHGHCHQKALYGTAAMKRLLSLAEGTHVQEVDSGCCGMAGSFGFEAEHYELSQKIGEDRLFPAIRALPEGAAIVACGTSCRQQIEHFTERPAIHWVQAAVAQRSR